MTSWRLELKYLCQRVECDVGGERFGLKPQGAQDLRRYDVLKDIWRMERFLEGRSGASAAVLVIANDPGYWVGPKGVSTCDASFSLREGRIVTGTLDWAPHAGAGTKRGREAPIELRGCYTMNWQDYSRIDAPFGLFRFLHVRIQAGSQVLPPSPCRQRTDRLVGHD